MRLSTADILKLLPEFMRDDEAVKGLAAAVNKLIKEPGNKIDTVRVWDQIDELDDAQLDELAYELNIDWYRSNLPIENKRAIVKISDLVHSRRGTKWAVEHLISAYFASGKVVEWHEAEYGDPKPFHFFVCTSERDISETTIQEFKEIAKIAMPARSRMDEVYFSDTYGKKVIASKEEAVHIFTPKKCGTLPRRATVGVVVSNPGVVASATSVPTVFDIEEAGATEANSKIASEA